MAKMVHMRQEKWVPPILTRGTDDPGGVSVDHEPPDAQRRATAVVKIGQVWYEKHQCIVYDPYLRRRYAVEMWVSVPEHLKA